MSKNMNKKKQKKDQTRINDSIPHNEVRVVDEDEENKGVFSLEEAIDMANEKGEDLVEISPNANPPVCKIIEYSKFNYQQKKKQKEEQKKNSKNQLKEIKFGPNTAEHDYNFKKKNAEKFLNKGMKVRFFIKFKGREKGHKEQGEQILNRLMDELSSIAKVDQKPEYKAGKMTMILSPSS